MYQLSTSLVGHNADVVGLAVAADDSFISCSRDRTTKIWKYNGITKKFFEAEIFNSDHNLKCKFPMCVCVLLPSDLFEYGLILIGDNDKRIFVYEPNSAILVRQFQAHSNAVSKIVNSAEPNVFLSASWDSTVKMWLITEENVGCLLTINHSASVWAVMQMNRKFILTGSADKIIRVFHMDGSLLRILIGHEDCVRDLVQINDDEILSCSNDTTVRRWSVNSGKCLEILCGHPNYVYSVRIVGNLILSSGEDRCLMLWSQGIPVQTITLPARSIWAIDVLSNSDIVVGTSDGIVRIFTADETRLADEQALLDFARECSSLQVPFKKVLGRAKFSRLPGPEVLSTTGNKEGQIVLVRESEKVNCYSWSITEKIWKNVGAIDVNCAPAKRGKNLEDAVKARREKLTLKEPKKKLYCVICRRTFFNKCNLRQHFNESNHSIDNKTPRFLLSVLPNTRPYHVIYSKRKGSCFMVQLCLPNINSYLDLQKWVRNFIGLNNCGYSRHSIKRCSPGGFTYSEFYRCEHSGMTKVNSRKIQSKATGCRSSINCLLKHDPDDNSCYGKINVNFNHNHPVDNSNKLKKPTPEVRDVFRRLYHDGYTPGKALRAYKASLQLRLPEAFHYRLLDRSVCPDYDWVRHFFRKIKSAGNAEEEVGIGQKSRGPYIWKPVNLVEQPESSVGAVGLKVEQDERDHTGEMIFDLNDEGDVETELYDAGDIDEVISEEKVEGSIDKCPRILRELVDEFNVFLRKLEEDPSYYESGILSMKDELEKLCHSTAESRLLALYSFNRISSNTI